MEVIQVFKGDNEVYKHLQVQIIAYGLQVGQMITTYGPDLLSSCGNPQNILSVSTTYVVGIGGPCSAHSEWTPYSQYSTEERRALSDGCNGSESIHTFGQITLMATIIATYIVLYI